MRVSSDISLILLEPEHSTELFNLIDRNRIHLRKWLRWVDSVTFEESVLNFINTSQKQQMAGHELHFAIQLNRKLIGVIGMHIVGKQKARFGYWLGQKYCGKGIMTMCCTRLTDYVFENISVNKAEIRCAKNNVQSRSIPISLGFEEENSRKTEWLYDKQIEVVGYSISAKKWYANLLISKQCH